MMEFVSWDDDIPNYWGKIKAMFQTTNQQHNWRDTTLPSGKHTKNNEKSPSSMAKSTISMAMFQFANCECHYQRTSLKLSPLRATWI
jgi:hypothetical protein